MNSSVPKQFMLLKGKPVIYYPVKCFLSAYNDLEVILVLPKDHIATGEGIVDSLFGRDRIRITEGGATRFDSVKNGLQLVTAESIVFVHDAVRCLVTVDLIHRCFKAAVEKGSAIPVIDSRDSIRYLSGGTHTALDRTRIRLVQTPQTFSSNILQTAFRAEYLETFTDEATVAEASGFNMNLVEGEENNFKITRPIDLILAEHLLSRH